MQHNRGKQQSSPSFYRSGLNIRFLGFPDSDFGIFTLDRDGNPSIQATWATACMYLHTSTHADVHTYDSHCPSFSPKIPAENTIIADEGNSAGWLGCHVIYAMQQQRENGCLDITEAAAVVAVKTARLVLFLDGHYPTTCNA
jgi:hypothetical protein